MSDAVGNRVGSVEYRLVDSGYFKKRGLRRYAGLWSLWALGVGAVISGDFFGWNFGLAVGGFGGLAIATVIVAVMYLGLCYSIAEMSPAMPHSGGAYSFAHRHGAMGRVHHRVGGVHRVYLHARGHRGGDRRLYGHDNQRSARHRASWAGLVVDFLRALRRDQRRRGVADVSDIHGPYVSSAGHFNRLLVRGNSPLQLGHGG